MNINHTIKIGLCSLFAQNKRHILVLWNNLLILNSM